MLKKILIYIVFTIILTSCLIEFYGLTNDYDTLSELQKKDIRPLESFEKTESKIIYKINASQLKEELKKHSKSIVYVFANGCVSKTCKALNLYEAYANDNGYKLFFCNG